MIVGANVLLGRMLLASQTTRAILEHGASTGMMAGLATAVLGMEDGNMEGMTIQLQEKFKSYW